MSSLGVFSTKVASRNIANIILARGAQKLGTTLFLLHASQAAAEAAVHCRSELEKEPVPKESLQVGPDSNGKVIAQVKRSDQLSALPSSSRAATLKAKWVSNSSLPPLLPLPRVQSDQIVSAFAPHPTPPHSYRDALLLGSTPPPKPPARLAGVRISSTACFRCFATDHQIRACREPVRCRRCGLSGHRERHCAKPTNSSFTSRGHPARRATIPPAPCSSRTTPTPPAPPMHPVHMHSYKGSGPCEATNPGSQNCSSHQGFLELRVVVLVKDVNSVPCGLWVRDVSAGTICSVDVLRAWPLAKPMDAAASSSMPFFRPAPLLLPPPLHPASPHARPLCLLPAPSIASLQPLSTPAPPRHTIAPTLFRAVASLAEVADRKSTRLNSSHSKQSRMPSSA